MPPTDKMTLLVQTPHAKESMEYFISLQSLDYNEDGKLESSREDQYSHWKMLRNGKLNIIEDLEEQFNESFI
jgi:hypothetical protein